MEEHVQGVWETLQAAIEELSEYSQGATLRLKSEWDLFDSMNAVDSRLPQIKEAFAKARPDLTFV